MRSSAVCWASIRTASGLRAIAALARFDPGFSEVASLPLAGTLATNVAATADEDGRLVLAAGTDDGRLRLFR